MPGSPILHVGKRRRASEWAPIYLVLVVAIALVLLITLVKPMFRGAQASASSNLDTAQTIAKSALFP